MPVIEIAKIQVRRGQEQQTGVPPLAGGEFAWAADTENLYIGLRREDGGARDANIRLLTENDLRNFFAASNSGAVLTATYIYRAGTDITKYPTTIDGQEFGRALQEKLDDIVSIKDFGVEGDGGDNTQDERIQAAIDNLFLRTDRLDFALNGEILPPAKTLYFPAGHYSITGTIFIPANVSIVGDGIDKTILTLKSDGEHVFQTVEADGRRAFIIREENTTTDLELYGYNDAIANSLGIFTSTGQQTTMSPSYPKHIHIEGMTIQYETTTTETTLTGGISLVSLDCAENALIRRVKFKGNFNEDKIADINYCGIDIRGYGQSDLAITSEHVLIDDCYFENIYAGIKSDYNINDVTIQNSYFYKTHHGVAFNKSTIPTLYTVVDGHGPKNCKILNNKFEDVQEEAIFVGENISGSSSNIISQGNTFLNVGNYGRGDVSTSSTGGTAIITFLTGGNSTVDDYFSRKEFLDANDGFTYSPLINGRAAIDYSSTPTAIVPAGGSTVIMKWPITGRPQFIDIKYSLYADLGLSQFVDRQGHAKVFIKSGEDPEIVVVDDFTTISLDGGLYWGVSVDTDYKLISVAVYNPPQEIGGTGYPIEIQYQPKITL
jgi:hypothetical protein